MPDESERAASAADWVPRPDPTRLTTDQLRREIAGLREVIDARFVGIAHETDLLRGRMAQISAEIGEKIKWQQDLQNEKFAGIQIQFTERDLRARTAADAAMEAVSAALQAQKEAAAARDQSTDAAITKGEAATTKQIDGLQSLMNSTMSALNDKIGELQSRVDRGEGREKGTTDNSAKWMSAVALAITVLFFIYFIEKHQMLPVPSAPAAVAVVPIQPKG